MPDKMVLEESERQALVEVLEYLFADEEKNYVETYGENSVDEPHIFSHVRRLGLALLRHNLTMGIGESDTP